MFSLLKECPQMFLVECTVAVIKFRYYIIFYIET